MPHENRNAQIMPAQWLRLYDAPIQTVARLRGEEPVPVSLVPITAKTASDGPVIIEKGNKRYGALPGFTNDKALEYTLFELITLKRYDSLIPPPPPVHFAALPIDMLVLREQPYAVLLDGYDGYKYVLYIPRYTQHALHLRKERKDRLFQLSYVLSF